MNKVLKIFLIIVPFVFASCSFFKKKQDPMVEETLAGEVESDDEMEGEEIVDDFDEEDSDESTVAEDSEEETAIEENEMEQEMAGETKLYKVQSGETLMLIAFKLYGDYSKWRELYSLNKGRIRGANGVGKGAVLKYRVPGKSFNWPPNGNPYLIKNGDTLSKISNKVYGKFDKWRSIYNNNRPMIKNPNLIFSGFEIYYLDQDQI